MQTTDICLECYAVDKRITPLLNSEDCLLHHRQYICGTCGRCICADVDDKGRFRALSPFKTLEIAKLYLRAAEIIHQCACSIYEIADNKGRKQYKIFPSVVELNDYLQQNKQKHCNLQPLFTTPKYKDYASGQLRKLSAEEVAIYMKEKQLKTL